MALDNFIPTIWSARLLQSLQKALVYGQVGVVNRDYEGEIREAGNTVKIQAIGAVTVGTYIKNSNMSAPETLTDATLSLLIDQSKYFNFQIDDIDKAQQKPKVMSEAMREAGYALADTADQYIASLYANADAGNLIGTTAAPKTDLGTAGKAYEYLLQLGRKLTDAKVPKEGRWVIVPTWFTGLLLTDQRFVNTGSAQAEDRIQNAMIGRAAGFNVLESLNVPNTTATKYRIIAGHPMAWSYAEQINGVEAYRPELRFADAVKGLHVYGAKVVRPTALAVLTANAPA
jgi:N4-gp56 family major capsid protein